MSRKRLRLFVFLVKIWRAWLCPRLNLPEAVERKRFAAPLCVLSLGIIILPKTVSKRSRSGPLPVPLFSQPVVAPFSSQAQRRLADRLCDQPISFSFQALPFSARRW